jgi:hypothetical protein
LIRIFRFPWEDALIRKSFWLSLVLVPFLIVGLACGGGDDDDDAGASPSDGAASPTAATDSGGGGGSSSDSDSDSDSDNTSDSDDEVVDLEDCDAVTDLISGSAFAAGGSGPEDLQDTAEFFQELADRVPDEISDDMQVFADAFVGYLEALEEAGLDLNNPAALQNASPAQLAQLQAAAEAFSAADVVEASENIQAYFEAECS